MLTPSTPCATDDLMTALTLENQQLRTQIEGFTQQIAALKHQLDWFKRQLFGAKSERFVAEVNPQQLHLGEALPVPDAIPEERYCSVP